MSPAERMYVIREAPPGHPPVTRQSAEHANCFHRLAQQLGGCAGLDAIIIAAEPRGAREGPQFIVTGVRSRDRFRGFLDNHMHLLLHTSNQIDL